MFFKHITVSLFLGLFFAQVSQTTASNISASVAPTTTITVSNSSINNANSSNSNYSLSISPTATFLPTTMTSSHPTTEAPTTEPTCPASGEPTKNSTCGLLTLELDSFTWNPMFKDELSPRYKMARKVFFAGLCKDLKSYGTLVMLSNLSFNMTFRGGTIVNVKLCLHVSKGVDLEEVLRNKTENSTFEAIEVSYPEWKAKDDECKKCGEEGGGGPFVIVNVCKSGKHSCKGLKNKSKYSKDCEEYCSSTSSLVVAAVSNLILALWISLSFK